MEEDEESPTTSDVKTMTGIAESLSQMPLNKFENLLNARLMKTIKSESGSPVHDAVKAERAAHKEDKEYLRYLDSFINHVEALHNPNTLHLDNHLNAQEGTNTPHMKLDEIVHLAKDKTRAEMIAQPAVKPLNPTTHGPSAKAEDNKPEAQAIEKNWMEQDAAAVREALTALERDQSVNPLRAVMVPDIASSISFHALNANVLTNKEVLTAFLNQDIPGPEGLYHGGAVEIMEHGPNGLRHPVVFEKNKHGEFVVMNGAEDGKIYSAGALAHKIVDGKIPEADLSLCSRVYADTIGTRPLSPTIEGPERFGKLMIIEKLMLLTHGATNPNYLRNLKENLQHHQRDGQIVTSAEIRHGREMVKLGDQFQFSKSDGLYHKVLNPQDVARGAKTNIEREGISADKFVDMIVPPSVDLGQGHILKTNSLRADILSDGPNIPVIQKDGRFIASGRLAMNADGSPGAPDGNAVRFLAKVDPNSAATVTTTPNLQNKSAEIAAVATNNYSYSL